MNIWAKSLLTGVIIAITIYFILNRSGSRSATYAIEYTIETAPTNKSGKTFPVSKVISMLEKRMKTAGWKYKITQAGNDLIRVALFKMKDTLYPRSIFANGAKLQFREIYLASELAPMLTAFVELSRESEPLPPAKTIAPVKRDSMSKTASDLLDSMERFVEQPVESAGDLVEFSIPYADGSGKLMYFAEIGSVKENDTAVVRKLFEDERIKRSGPPNARLFYGPPKKMGRVEKKNEMIPLYFINTRNDPDKAPLESEDVIDARQDFTREGAVSINMQFSDYGARKWAIMTRSNIGRPIAIIFNGLVISAPNVLDEIADGNSSITGNYSVTESEDMVRLLKTGSLPFSLSILSAHIVPEKPSGTSKKLLPAMFGFLIASGLTFFVFKTLKPTPTRSAGDAQNRL
ncbi:MAG TPA: hypothetical protein VGO58_05335 [Chitinophagaceae bacterium]|jgi:SecD/SecF fusion protein|nr:hypothetical protein [Chitinophagaceae bacterium]